MTDPSVPPPAAYPEPAKKKPAGLIWAGVIVIIISVIALVGSIVVLVQGVGAFSGDDFSVPGVGSVQLESGTYAVWVSDGTMSSQSRTRAVVAVEGPSGPVAVREPGLNMTFTSNNVEYVARAEFDVTTAGTYEVAVDSETAELARVSPPLSVGRLAGGIIGIVFSGLLFVVGLVLLILGIVLRSRAGRRSSGPPVVAPPAPAPGAPGASAPPPYEPPPAPTPPPPAGVPSAPAPPEPPPGGWRPPGDEQS